MTENGNITVNANAAYNAITQKAVKHTVTFEKNGASSVSPTSKSCT